MFQAFGLSSQRMYRNHPATTINVARHALRQARICYDHQSYLDSAVMVRRALQMICRPYGMHDLGLRTGLNELRKRSSLPRYLNIAIDRLTILDDDWRMDESSKDAPLASREVGLGIALAEYLLHAHKS